MAFPLHFLELSPDPKEYKKYLVAAGTHMVARNWVGCDEALLTQKLSPNEKTNTFFPKMNKGRHMKKSYSERTG